MWHLTWSSCAPHLNVFVPAQKVASELVIVEMAYELFAVGAEHSVATHKWRAGLAVILAAVGRKRILRTDEQTIIMALRI